MKLDTGAIARIARDAGVSERTVYRVLRGGNKENWESTVRRAEEIRALAIREGYVTPAKAVEEHDVIGLVTSAAEDEAIDGQFLERLQDRLTEARLGRLARIREPLTSKSGGAVLGRQRLKALVAVGECLTEPENAASAPVVWVHSRRAADCVCPDWRDATAEATRRLLKLGHSKIGLVARASDPKELDDGYEHALREVGLPSRSVRCWGRSAAEREAVAHGLLSGDDRPTAVICTALEEFAAVRKTCRALGIAIPAHLAVLGIDDLCRGWSRAPTAALMRAESDELAVAVVHQLSRKIKKPSEPLAPLMVKLRLRDGETCVGPGTVSD